MELIDRQAFIERERKLYCDDCDKRKGMKNGKLTVCYEIGEAPCRSCWLDDALTDLEDAPTIHAVPVRHGAWEVISVAKTGFSKRVRCTYCKEERIYAADFDNYCPNCGARMTGESNG